MKDFDDWNVHKQDIEKRELIPEFQEREVWWCSIGKNIGNEQDGKNDMFERPILILKKFNRFVCFIVPMSLVKKQGKYYYQLEKSESKILLSQLRLISAKRLMRKVRTITRNEYEIIKE